ncbi:MAG: hypothetical protein EGR92_09950 [[Eubacterium] rectale]|nr:hypothetical protein [Agathobacter rectalis]
MNTALFTADEEFMKEEEGMEDEKEMEDEDEEDMTEGELWDDVMSDFFPECKTEEELADALDDLWND